MSNGTVRLGVGTRVIYDGEVLEVVELRPSPAGNDVVLRSPADQQRVVHVALRELLASHRARVATDLPGPSSDDLEDPATVVLAGMTDAEREAVAERTAHVREALTGYRSGSQELAQPGEPRSQFDGAVAKLSRGRRGPGFTVVTPSAVAGQASANAFSTSTASGFGCP